MDVFEAIKKRRSIRKFDPERKLTAKQIEKLLTAACWAPSAGNLQSYFIYVVRNKELKEKFSQVSKYQDFIRQAAAVFVFCVDFKRVSYYKERGRTLYCFQDAAIAAENMWLTLTEMGLGGVWVGNIDERSAERILKTPKHLRPVSLLVVGYAAEKPKPSRRRELKSLAKIL